MKRINLKIVAILGIASLTLISCGSSRTRNAVEIGSLPSKAYGEKIEDDECEILANQKPSTRVVGTAVSGELSDAIAYAELNARSRFANAINSKVKAAAELNKLDWEQMSSNSSASESVSDEGRKKQRSEYSLAEEVISNAVVIKTSKYRQPNGRYRVFVCLEYQGDSEQMAQQVINKVKQRVSDDDRLKMQYEFNKFEEKVKEDLKNMRVNQ